MRANARSRLKWRYGDNGSQTATWENRVFAVWLDMNDAEGKRWHLTTWEADREALTKAMIFKSESLASVYQHTERLVGDLAQFMGVEEAAREDDRHALNLEMHIFEGDPPEFRTSAEVIESIREASVALRHAAAWLYGAPVSKERLPIVEAVAGGLSATAEDIDKRLADIEWSLNE
jgi:hypothetical protein